MDYIEQQAGQQVGIKTPRQSIYQERFVGVSECTESMRQRAEWGGLMGIVVFCLFYYAQVFVYEVLGGSLYKVYRLGNGHSGRKVNLNYNGSHFELACPEGCFTTPQRASKTCFPKKKNRGAGARSCKKAPRIEEHLLTEEAQIIQLAVGGGGSLSPLMALRTAPFYPQRRTRTLKPFQP